VSRRIVSWAAISKSRVGWSRYLRASYFPSATNLQCQVKRILLIDDGRLAEIVKLNRVLATFVTLAASGESGS
jgi:hypothetical protein